MTEPKTIEHDPNETQRVNWRAYREKVLTKLAANTANVQVQADADEYMPATIRLAQALHPAFVIWCAKEFGLHESDNLTAFVAFQRAMPWMFLHLAQLIQGSNGEEAMARGLLAAVTKELDDVIASVEDAEEPAPVVAGTA